MTDNQKNQLRSLLEAVEAEFRFRARISGGMPEEKWRSLICTRSLHNAVKETELILGVDHDQVGTS